MCIRDSFGLWSSRTRADKRIYAYNVALLFAMLVQLVLAIWYVVNPDVISDAANKSCQTGTTCDAQCHNCEKSVQDIKDYVQDHNNMITVLLWVIFGVEVLAIISAYCKQSRAQHRLEEPLLDDTPPTEAAMVDKYGAGAQVFTAGKTSYKIGQ
eukprot:TRINITY_DN4632_c0_g1_i1.p1 TRINITY_DN4632_c0_g1~~TRINITY_DN4632_c0_g1_i1.p1  ORF type:complete len:154 (+),score=56.06 TRINITY_DN4632_c0_g1_i1:131-592(+)